MVERGTANLSDAYARATRLGADELSGRLDQLRASDPELHALVVVQTLRLGLAGYWVDPPPFPTPIDPWARLRVDNIGDLLPDDPTPTLKGAFAKDDPIPVSPARVILRRLRAIQFDPRWQLWFHAVVAQSTSLVPPGLAAELCCRLKRDLRAQWLEKLAAGQIEEPPDVPCECG
ncbi:MAG: hypothetical protein AAFX79_09600 [Planctomycetota bacterium]